MGFVYRNVNKGPKALGCANFPKGCYEFKML